MGSSVTIGGKKYELFILASIAVYSIAFSYSTYLKHMSFLSYAWDLGTFDQIMYSSVFAGKPFYYSADLFMNGSGNYLAIHFSPILALLFPIYFVAPGIPTLLVIKSVAIGAAAYPLFRIVRRLTGSDIAALCVGLAYLLNPGIQGANWFDFQPQSLAPLLIFSTYYLLIAKRWAYYFPALTLTLMIEEHITLVVLLLLVSQLIYSRRGDSKRLLDLGLRENQVFLVSVILCLASYGASATMKVVYPIRPEFRDVYAASSAYGVLGYGGDVLSAPIRAILDPQAALGALTHDSALKLLYMLMLFAPLLFVPFMSGFLAVNALLVVPFMLSNYRPYYMIGSHYTLYFMPSFFIMYAYAVSRLKERGTGVAKAALIASTVIIAALSPVSPLSGALSQRSHFLWYPEAEPPGQVEAVHLLLSQVPGDASILTQNHVFPHVSSRIEAYVLPVLSFDRNQTRIVEDYVDSLINHVEYVLLDTTPTDQWTTYARGRLEGSVDHAAMRVSGAVLYRRTKPG
jgi:uncharacterized membrane protein